MIRNRMWIPIAITAAFFIWHPQRTCSTSFNTKIEPNLIVIGTFFNGTRLAVSGKVGVENGVAVVVSGHQEELTLKQKGKVLGFLWMNLEDVEFKKVPKLYILYSSMEGIESDGTDRNILEKLGIGFEYLKKEMEIEAPKAEWDALAEEFLKLKQNQGLYAFHPGEIRFEQRNETEKFFTASIWIPPQIPAGDYQIRVIEIHNGHTVDNLKNQLSVKEEGIPLMLSSLAFNHSLLYGFFAVLIAVGAGLAMDFFFGSGKGGGAH